MDSYIEYKDGASVPEQEFLRGEHITVVKLMEISPTDSYFGDTELIGAIFVQARGGLLGLWRDDGTYYMEETRVVFPDSLARKWEGVTFSFHSVKLHHLFSI